MNRNRRIGVVHTALAFLALAILVKTAHVQLVQGRAWSDLARRQHYTSTKVPAPRGVIMDAGGRTLATTREVVRLEVAPREVRSRDFRKLSRALVAAGVEPAWAARATDTQRSWVVLPGRFVAEDVAPITAIEGVHTTPVSDRTYAASPGLRSVLGRVDAEGRGLDGLELTLDSVLRGTHGASQLERDVRGRSFASPTIPGRAPTPGHSVTLTINHELQEIAERTLSDAVARMNAEGGDIVILDPRTGEILALAGERSGVMAPSVTAVTEPFEPGSTLKPLIAAALLARGKARPEDIVPTRGGSYELHGRTIHDEPHPGPVPSSLSLADVIRFSSNIGIVQFAERLEPREEFEVLRDFGIGTPTGLLYSSEAAGTLRAPRTWSRQTPASLAMGYEVSMTPLQLALAYAAIANGGELLEPILVKEIRTPDGALRFRQARRVVRRVLSAEIAKTVRQLLSGVVERGTAVDADLATYALAGKTGTPRRTVNGRYAPMQYNPNFVGLFPADAPQLVVVVKVSSPKGAFHGGRTAAPMTKTIVQAALAARDAALDRSKLAARGPSRIVGEAVQSGRSRTPVATAIRDSAGAALGTDTAKSVVLDLPPKPERGPSALKARIVPNVRGLSLRDAVRSLHFAGFRVQLTSGGPSTPVTEPAPGALASAGSVVRLRYSR
jgi:cell division protein FtsI (penicillin-binding protein 3)